MLLARLHTCYKLLLLFSCKRGKLMQKR